jgi:23S rRNA (cytidine1920-2'-O)/16S rRNA (cytidine1409-2'-O)-methyltransferase
LAIYKKMRLDRIMVERGLAATRSRAADLIRLGAVTVGGIVAEKAGMLLAPDAALAVERDALPYVSRAGLKLAAALDAFGFDPAGRVALDLGASTGGFTEVLLERGAERIFAVEVGHGQLHAKLRADRRVVALEETDARALDRTIIPEPVGAITADMSFISLSKALPAALKLAARCAWLVVLVKPQFEAGPKAVGKGGIVRDPRHRAEAVENVRRFLAEEAGWTVIGVIPSPLQGADGNEEFLLGAVRPA